jgi:2'-5' RNA ligase
VTAAPAPELRARLFVALDLPEDVRAALAEWGRRELTARRELRVVAPESLHVTLCFLGHRPEAEIPLLAGVVEREAAPVPGLAIAGVRWLPSPSRARVLAVELSDPAEACAALQRQVGGALADAGVWEFERRRFLPHVTAARVRQGLRPGRARVAPPPEVRFAGAALTLYRSRLGGGPARYEPLVRRTLPRNG